MQSLLKTQKQLMDYILQADPTAMSLIKKTHLDASQHLQVYVNNARLTLTAHLKTTFPVIVKLGGEKFFNYLAAEFIKTHPPTQTDITFYGAAFPAFLENLPALKNFPYMADVARLEWAREAVFHTPSSNASQLLHSPWAVHRIWQINVNETGEELDLDQAGEAHLKIYRHGNEMLVEEVDKQKFIELQKASKS